MKRFKKLYAVLLISILAITLLLSGCGKTDVAKGVNSSAKSTKDNSWQKVNDKGEIVVGLCAEYAPFESKNEKTNQIEGFDIDMANAIGKELGVKVKVVDAQWEALIGGVTKGDYDVIISCMAKKEAASGNVNMSDVYYNLNEVMVVNQGDTSIKTVADLKGKTIGVQTQTSSEQAADKISGTKEIKRYNRTPEAFIDLKNKRIDAVIVGYAYAVTELKDSKDLKILDAPVESNGIVMVMKKGNDSLTAKMNGALTKIKQNGKYNEAINKWLKLK